jgi:peptide/nickel transport system permease protein
MLRYVVQRLILAVPTLFIVTVLVFAGLRLALPTDVVDRILGDYAGNDPELAARLRDDLGLSSSIPNQYMDWVGISWFWGGPEGVLQGNLGESLHSKRSVASELKRRLPVSVELGLWAQLTTLLIAIPLGVWASVKQDKWPDYGLRSIAILLNAVPGFWIAILLLTFGSLWFDWAPPLNFKYIQEDPIAHLEFILVPAIIIGLTPSGGLLRLVRTQMLEVLRQDFVRTAQAKGLSDNVVFYRHALRNAIIPVITVIGIGLPNLIAGTVIFEQIFLIPGMGRYFVSAVNNLDYPVIQGLILVFASMLMVSVILVDVAYAMVDPRIRFK